MLHPYFAVLGAGINLLGSAGYIWDTLKGRTKPNRVSWGLWAVSPLVAFAAELTQGVKLQSLMTLSSGLVPLAVFVVSFADRKAYWKIKRFDWYCAGLSVLSLVMWLITGEGNIAILFAIGADVLACVPTLAKSYTDPQTESASAFVAGTVASALTLLTISDWTFAHYAFPAYLLVANAAIAATILVRGRRPA
jgi:hypothetical protein